MEPIQLIIPQSDNVNTVARLTNKQTSPEQNIPLHCSSNDFMNFFTKKIESIRHTTVNVQSFMVSFMIQPQLSP